jgi:hypothetical protein
MIPLSYCTVPDRSQPPLGRVMARLKVRGRIADRRLVPYLCHWTAKRFKRRHACSDAAHPLKQPERGGSSFHPILACNQPISKIRPGESLRIALQTLDVALLACVHRHSQVSGFHLHSCCHASCSVRGSDEWGGGATALCFRSLRMGQTLRPRAFDRALFPCRSPISLFKCGGY